MNKNFLYIILIIVSLLGISYIVLPDKWKIVLGKLKENETIINLRKENEELKKQNEEIEKKRKELREQIKEDSLFIVNLQAERVKIDKQLDKKDIDIERTKGKLNDVLKEQNITKENINKIKSTPNEKRGEELIFSISKRLK